MKSRNTTRTRNGWGWAAVFGTAAVSLGLASNGIFGSERAESSTPTPERMLGSVPDPCGTEPQELTVFFPVEVDRLAEVEPAAVDTPDSVPQEIQETAPALAVDEVLAAFERDRPGMPVVLADLLRKLETAGEDQGLRDRLVHRLQRAVLEDAEARDWLLEFAIAWSGSSIWDHPVHGELWRALGGCQDQDFVRHMIDLQFEMSARQRELLVERGGGPVGSLLRASTVDVRRRVLGLLTGEDLADAELAGLVRTLAIEDPDPKARIFAIRAQEKILEDGESVELLQDLVANEQDLEVRQAAVQTLMRVSSDSVREQMIVIARSDDDVGARRLAMRSLRSQETTPELLETLLDGVENEDRWIKLNAIGALEGHASEPGVGEVLLGILARTEDEREKLAAINAARQSPMPELRDVIERIVQDPMETDRVRKRARSALKVIEAG